MMKNRKWNDSGFTLVELLASSLIVLIAIIGLFVGIQFTENQVFRNYRIRRAILLNSARLEYQNFLKQKYSTFLIDDQRMPIYKSSYSLDVLANSRKLDASFDTEIHVSDYAVNLNFYDKTRITVTCKWKEPSRGNKEQKVILMEDYYASKQ